MFLAVLFRIEKNKNNQGSHNRRLAVIDTQFNTQFKYEAEEIIFLRPLNDKGKSHENKIT